jgi:hypothetical protein
MGKKSKAPPPPDYAALAKQQADLNQAAVDKQTQANRINQTSATGGTLTYSQDPTTGAWSQKEAFSPEQQALYDQQVGRQQQLSGAADQSFQGLVDQWGKPLDTSGMQAVSGLDPSGAHAKGGDVNAPDASQYQHIDPSKLGQYGNLDFSNLGQMPDGGFGNVKEVQDAMMALQQPGMDKARQQEQQRLAAMGFSEGDQGYQGVMTQQNNADNDARLKALLAGTTEYGNIFNRQLQARQQGASEDLNKAQYDSQNVSRKLADQVTGSGFENNLLGTQQNAQQQASQYANALRGQDLSEMYTQNNATAAERNRQMNEALAARQRPMDEYKQISSMINPVGPEFEQYNKAGGAAAADVQGAAQKTYQAQVDQANADAARKAGVAGGILKLAGTAAGSFFGMPQVGAAIGGMLSPKAGVATAAQPLYGINPQPGQDPYRASDNYG